MGQKYLASAGFTAYIIVDSILRSLNLPAALEALEKPIGLPPSLLKKAEEVRTANGPSRIQSSIDNVRKLAKRNMDLLNEVRAWITNRLNAKSSTS